MEFNVADLVEAACHLVDAGTMTLPQLVSTCEKMVLHKTLQKAKASSSQIAKQLGLSRRTLYNKIRKYELSDPRRSPPRGHGSQRDTSRLN